MKKILLSGLMLAIVATAFVGYSRYIAPATAFSEKEKFVYIPTKNATRQYILDELSTESIVKNINHLDWLASKMKYWENIRPGRYKIEHGMGIREIVTLLRSGNQTSTKLVINKLRLPQDFAKVMARALESDSAEVMKLLANPDSLKSYGITAENWPAYVIPDTYEVYWTWTPGRTLKKLLADRERWWSKNNRNERAHEMGLTPQEIHIIASIVEEETNKAEDKPKVASVYLNRIKLGMPLQADPTVRFAMKDFKSNRVLYTHLRTPSPYNTYLNKGLPPGPICTASPSSLDAVLNAPETDYIFFVADADLRGGSTFTSTLSEHNKAARIYQDSLSAWLKRKAVRQKAEKDSLEKIRKDSLAIALKIRSN
jgi:UPF0755 protein